MARDFESFIVDPNLLDPDIDATDLATTTDTRKELLSSVPDYAGIQYDPTQKDYLGDLYALYSGQLPSRPETPSSTPPPSGGGQDSGGGGQVATPPTGGEGSEGIIPDNTFIGGGATLEDAGGTYDGYQSQEGGFEYTGTPMDIGYGDGQVDPKLADAVGGIDTTPVSGGNLTTLPSGDVYATDDPMLSEKIDYTPEQESTVQNILGQVGQTVEGALSALGKIPGAVVDFTNQTVDIFGKKLNVGKTLAGAVLNKLAGGPVSLLFGLAGSLPPGIKDTTNIARKIGLLTGDTTVTQDKYGINTQSQFGDYDKYNVDQVDKLENALANAKNKYATEQEYLDATVRMRTELKDRKNYLNEKGLKTIDQQIDEGIKTAEDDSEDDMLNTSDKIDTTAPSDLELENQYEDEDRFIGDTTDTTVTGVTRPGTGTDVDLDQTVADNNINITGGFPTYDTLPEGASKTGTPIDALNPINRQQHFDNTEKLKDEVRSGKLTNEEYNILSAFDARKTMGLGAVTGTGASAVYQGTQTAAGIGKELFGLDPAYAGDQSVKEAIDDTIRNIQGVSGNVSPELQVRYQEIISGKDIYRDPILGMVEEDENILADEEITNIEDYITEEDLSGGFEAKEEAKKQKQLEETAKKQRELQQKIKDAENKEAERVAAAEKAAADKAKAQRIAQEKIREAERQERERVATAEKAAAAKAKAQREMKEKIARAEKEEADRQAAAQKAAEAKAKAEREAKQKIREAENREAERQAAERQRAAEKAAKDKRDMQQRIRDAENNRQEQEARDRATREKDLGRGPPGIGGGGDGGGGGCFLAGTLVTMADGSTKEVQKVDLGDNVAEGGKVFATGKFLVENLHDYKGIKVSGSHMVNEDGNWVRVEDSKHGEPLGDNEHTVYVFGSENRRILINGILFTDYFETTEQEKLINNEKDFFSNWKTYENKIDQDNINILNAS